MRESLPEKDAVLPFVRHPRLEAEEEEDEMEERCRVSIACFG